MTQFLMESGHSLGTQTSFFSRLTDSLPQPGDYFDTKILMLLLLFLELSVGGPSLSGQVRNRQGPSESPVSSLFLTNPSAPFPGISFQLHPCSLSTPSI